MVQMMKELVNFSVYPCDLERFGGDWSRVKEFLAHHGLDGVELLIGYDRVPDLPGGIVTGVHLPGCMGWFTAWSRDAMIALPQRSPDRDNGRQITCGRGRSELRQTLRHTLVNAAALKPDYAVIHLSSPDPQGAFTGSWSSTDQDVLDAAAELLNSVAETFPSGEPPVRLYFENLWCPGLTFLEPGLIQDFTGRLEFTNWAFLLDTGHLMNALRPWSAEDEAIGKLLGVVAGLPRSIRDRIEGMHLHSSHQGALPAEILSRALPPGFRDLPSHERLRLAMTRISEIDPHLPFTDPRCREIVRAVSPRHLTHELITSSLGELDRKIRVQRDALHHDTP